MGCVVSSTFLEDEDGVVRPNLGNHIVSLTSTTYGLLTTLDNPSPQTPPRPPPPPPPPLPPTNTRSSLPLRSETPEVINTWELMADLDHYSTPTKPSLPKKASSFPGKDNLKPLYSTSKIHQLSNSSTPLKQSACCSSLEMFERRCPQGGDHAAVLYTTTLRGVRKTFEDCNAVRAALEELGVWFKERDVSMDMGFREELRVIMNGSKDGAGVPKVFVRGRYIGGAEEVLRIHEEGGLATLLEGLPRALGGGVCDGCGGVRFLPCFSCSGSRKVVVAVFGGKEKGRVVRCPECNENGLVLCPICC